LAWRHEFTVSGYGPRRRFASPQAVCYDAKRERIWVADTGASRLVAFRKSGVPLYRLRRLVSDGKGGRMPGEPCAVVVDQRGRLIVCDRLSDRIYYLDFNGYETSVIDVTRALGANEPTRPGRLALGPDGRLYVAERNTMHVLVFGANGRFIRKFGGRGKAEGQFEMLADVAVDREGRVYALDSIKRSPVVQVFDPNGRWLRGFGRHGHEDRDFHLPVAIAADAAGRVWIADAFGHHVKAFTASGQFLAVFGEMGQADGQFFFPADVATGGDGTLYVLEKAGRRLQAFGISGAADSALGGSKKGGLTGHRDTTTVVSFRRILTHGR
ncbi:MAG: NHL repeat-containing protein, partial [Armatimonadota bacterium]